MNTIDPKQAAIFIAVFSVIALLINSTQGFGISQGGMPASASVSAAAPQTTQADVEQAQYLARYLNSGFTRKVGSRSIAIAVATENGKLDSIVNAAIASRFQAESIQIFPTFFKSEFVSDGLFNDAVASSGELFRKLNLPSSLDVLVLAREDVQYSQNASLENIFTATMSLVVTVVPVSGQGSGKTWTFTAYGPGFTKEVAREAAEERLIKQIAADTKMSLN